MALAEALLHVILSSKTKDVSGLPKPEETRSASLTLPLTLPSKLSFQQHSAIHTVLRSALQHIRSGLEKTATRCWGVSLQRQPEPLSSKSILLAQHIPIW